MREKLLDFQSLSSCLILLLSCYDFREANSLLQNYGVDVFGLIESVILLATVWEILKLPELCQWGQNYYGLLVSINRPLSPLRYTCDDWFTSIWSQGLALPTDHYLSVLVLETEELLDGDVFIFAVWSVAFINCPMLMASVLEDGHPKCMGNWCHLGKTPAIWSVVFRSLVIKRQAKKVNEHKIVSGVILLPCFNVKLMANAQNLKKKITSIGVESTRNS